MKIKYCITTCNETAELNVLLNHLIIHNILKNDIFVLVDNKNYVQEIIDICNKYEVECNIKYSLNNDFAEFKNHLTEFSTGYDYIFQLDADELPSTDLLNDITGILTYNTDVEVLGIPRKNIVHGITDEHIKQWNWKVFQDKYINAPDFQFRIYSNNDKIKWIKPVHEQLTGYKKFSVFHEHLQTNPEQWEYYLSHNKSIEKQVKQNELYSKI